MKYFFILLILVLVCSCSESEEEGATIPEWLNATLAYYNVYSMSNSEGCPNIPGTYFLKDTSSCFTFFPAMGKYIEVKGNPSYRYSVPLKFGENERFSFESDPELNSRCTEHPKIDYIVKSYVSTYSIEVVSGKAKIDLENATELSFDGGVCKLVLSQR